MDVERQAKEVARSMFATSNYDYGSRGSLELFGVGQVIIFWNEHRCISFSIAQTFTFLYVTCHSVYGFRVYFIFSMAHFLLVSIR